LCWELGRNTRANSQNWHRSQLIGKKKTNKKGGKKGTGIEVIFKTGRKKTIGQKR
jgi:hypothetical protein